jgi:hypothetical protein
VLKANTAAGGASVQEIGAAAETGIEKNISSSAVRLELHRGQKERRYRVKKGKWSLVKAA